MVVLQVVVVLLVVAETAAVVRCRAVNSRLHPSPISVALWVCLAFVIPGSGQRYYSRPL